MQNVAWKRLALGAVAALALNSAAQTAEASIITSWKFDVSSDWKNPTWSDAAGPSSYVPGNPNVQWDAMPNGHDENGAGNLYDILKWGTPAPTSPSQSFLAVDDYFSNTVVTNDPFGAAGASVFHGNYKQNSSERYTYEKWLDTTTLQATITVTPDIDGAPVAASYTHNFQIEFKETINDGVPIGECEGNFTDPVLPCPDYFVVTLGNAAFDVHIGYTIYTFSLVFDVPNSTFLDISFDPENGTTTVWTAEEALTRLATRVVVTTRVPEPGAVGLLGAGLLGLGLAVRRRRKS